MIEVLDVSKNYNYINALKNVTFSINEGEIIGIFGENGAGKSTLFKCIFGYERYEGIIKIDGKKYSHANAGKLSYASSEHSFFPDMTADEHKEFYMIHFDTFKEDRYEMMMRFFGIATNMKLSELSVGQQNQYEIVLAFCQGAKYIFLDEPFISSDIFNREDFYKLILGVLGDDETIILSTHMIEEVSDFITRAIFIKKGEIIDDKSTEQLMDKGETLLGYFKKRYNYKSDRVANIIGNM